MAGLTATIQDQVIANVPRAYADAAIEPGAAQTVHVKLTCDDSYPADGYAYTPALFGLTVIDLLEVHGTDTIAYFAKHDDANKKIKLETAGAEVEAEVDCHTIGVFATVKGR